jgi:hypothetical protein
MRGDLDKAIIKIKLIPRSPRNEIVGAMADGTIKIKITAPPVDGQANQAVIKYLAETLKISYNNLEIISGKTSHNKLISISGIKQEAVNELLQKHFSN